jgi:hypothetical protein
VVMYLGGPGCAAWDAVVADHSTLLPSRRPPFQPDGKLTDLIIVLEMVVKSNPSIRIDDIGHLAEFFDAMVKRVTQGVFVGHIDRLIRSSAGAAISGPLSRFTFSRSPSSFSNVGKRFSGQLGLQIRNDHSSSAAQSLP